MKPRSILIATPYFFPKIGGLEAYAYETAHQLARQGWRVIVVCGDRVKQMSRETQEGITIYRLPIWKVISNTPINLLWPWYLRRIIKREDPSIINAHTPVPFMVDMAALAAGRRPFVVTYHAATLFKAGSLVMTIIIGAYRLIERLTLGRAQRLIAVSDYVKKALPSSLQTKTAIVYNATTTKKLPASQKTYDLVFVANLDTSHRWKGLDLILEALHQLKTTTGNSPRLLIIGDGSARAAYEDQASRLSLEKSITFAGRKTGLERDELMTHAHALIAYPKTANDAFPTVFLEAWALQLPVIAAGIGPLPELVEEGRTGIIVPANNPTELAKTLGVVLQDPKRLQALGRHGYTLVVEKYNWPVQTQAFEEVLESLL